MMPVLAGEGSCTVSFDTLIQNGVYDFYPALEQVISSELSNKTPRLNVALSMLRRFGFSSRQFGFTPQVFLTKEILDAAATLVAAFQPCFEGSTIYLTQAKLMAWFLSPQSRSPTDRELQQWLYYHHSSYSNAHPIATATGRAAISVLTAPELNQYHQLSALFHGRVLNLRMTSQPTINTATIATSKAEWHAWVALQEQRRHTRANRSLKDIGPTQERKYASIDQREGFAPGHETRDAYCPRYDWPWHNGVRRYATNLNAGLHEVKLEEIE